MHECFFISCTLKMIKKRFVALVFFLVLACSVNGADLGFFLGTNIDRGDFCYGLALDLGTIIPLLKIGFDYCRQKDQPLKLFSLDLKLKAVLGNFKPFLGMGIAAGWEKFNLKFSEYELYTFVTAGIFINFLKLFSLRLEGRFPFNREKYFSRITAGIFVSI